MAAVAVIVPASLSLLLRNARTEALVRPIVLAVVLANDGHNDMRAARVGRMRVGLHGKVGCAAARTHAHSSSPLLATQQPAPTHKRAPCRRRCIAATRAAVAAVVHAITSCRTTVSSITNTIVTITIIIVVVAAPAAAEESQTAAKERWRIRPHLVTAPILPLPTAAAFGAPAPAAVKCTTVGRVGGAGGGCGSGARVRGSGCWGARGAEGERSWRRCARRALFRFVGGAAAAGATASLRESAEGREER